MKRKRFTLPQYGTCRVCGCEDDRACPGGCSWVDAEHTICSACAGTPADLEHTLRWAGIVMRNHGLTPVACRAVALLMRDAGHRHDIRQRGSSLEAPAGNGRAVSRALAAKSRTRTRASGKTRLWPP